MFGFLKKLFAPIPDIEAPVVYTADDLNRLYQFLNLKHWVGNTVLN